LSREGHGKAFVVRRVWKRNKKSGDGGLENKKRNIAQKKGRLALLDALAFFSR
jgi:hypothetical protein